LNATVIDQDHCKRQLRLEIPSDTVRSEMDRIAGELSRKISVPGFRPGHVPKSVVKTRFRKELRDEVVSQLLPQAFGDAVKERELRVVGEPGLEELAFGEDESINVLFSFEVAPSFELADYKNIELIKPVYKVTDEDINKALDSLREKQAELVPVEDRPSAGGDIVSVSMSGRVAPAEGEAEAAAGSTQEHLSRREYDIDLDGEGVLPEFSSAFTGKRAGDTASFSVDYPGDYSSKSLAGRHVDYEGEIIAVRKKQLPDLDDEFASGTNDEFKTMDDLKAHIRADLEGQAGERSTGELQSAARDELLDRNRFDVPLVMVEQQMDGFLKSFARQMAQHYANPAKLELDWNAIRESQRERAEKSVRWAFIMNRIAQLEKVEVSDADVDAEIERIAEAVNKAPAAIRANLTKENGLDSIKEQIENRKALDLVIKSAQIREEEHSGVHETSEVEQGGAGEAHEKGEAAVERGEAAGEKAGEAAVKKD
jgi:trigger factor